MKIICKDIFQLLFLSIFNSAILNIWRYPSLGMYIFSAFSVC